MKEKIKKIFSDLYYFLKEDLKYFFQADGLDPFGDVKKYNNSIKNNK